MDITEVRIKLMESDNEERLLGFCSVTFDDAFVVRDVKIIRGTRGPFVAMPSRKLMDRCHKCSGKNQLRAAFCNQCGVALDDDRSHKHADGKARLYSDIAHPINSICRDMIQDRVLQAYERELVLAAQPGYVCQYEDYGENDSKSVSDDRMVEVRFVDQNNGKHRLDRGQADQRPHHSREKKSEVSRQPDDFGSGLF